MKEALKNLSMWAYIGGAGSAVVALLSLPFSYSTGLWEANVLFAMVGVGIVTATAVISATGLLSKNFPVHFLLVIGTALLVSTFALTLGQNAILNLVQLASLGLFIVFVVCRLVIEFVLNKQNAH